MIHRWSISVLPLVMVMLLAAPTRGHAITLSAGSATVNVGDIFSIPISITDAGELTSWQFDLAFTPAIVQANAVTEGPFLSSSGTNLTLFGPGVIDNGAGLISLVTDAYADLPPGPSGSGVLATIEFQALAVGVSPLTLSNVFLNLSDQGFQIVNGQVTVVGQAQVPEPSTVALLGLGLAALGIRRLARRRAAACRSA